MILMTKIEHYSARWLDWVINDTLVAAAIRDSETGLSH